MALVWLAAAPAVAQERGASGESEAWDRGTPWNAERAFVALERLQTEIGLLRGLAAAQAALLAWNARRADSGAGPAVLPAALCEEEGLAAWCRALPATFGDTRAADTRARDTRAGEDAAQPGGGGERERGER